MSRPVEVKGTDASGNTSAESVEDDDYYADGDSSLFRRFPACIFFIPLWLVTTVYVQLFYRNPAPSKFGEHETTEGTRKQ